MVLLRALLFVVCCIQIGWGSQTVDLIVTWPNSAEYHTKILKERGADIEVVISNLSQYEEALRYVSTRWSNRLRKWSLDFPKQVPLKEGTLRWVFFNIQDWQHQQLDLRRLPKEKLVLFHWEPPSVLGKMFKSRVTDCFGRVYTWNDDLVDGKKFFKLYYPDLRPMIDAVVPFEEKKLCTLVATNIQNKAKKSLYKERKKAIVFFEEVGEKGFEFYGRRWEEEGFLSYRGPVEDKIDAIKNYRFSICYENSQGLNGYITEKIFDCFAAGNVPIYWGASNIEKYVPKNCFIDRRDFGNIAEVYQFIKAMGKKEYEGYLDRIREFLQSDAAQLFSRKHFEEIFYQAVTQEV